jgi:hypothetical protein
MGLQERDYVRGSHPSHCTCARCASAKKSSPSKSDRERVERLFKDLERRRARKRLTLISLFLMVIITIFWSGPEILAQFSDLLSNIFRND